MIKFSKQHKIYKTPIKNQQLNYNKIKSLERKNCNRRNIKNK